MNALSNVTLRTGTEMPVLGLGTWQLTHNTADTIIYALKLGYRMIDTSGDYGTQPGIGEGIHKSGIARNNFYLITKIEENDDAYQAAWNNLKELRLDFADLILIHRPPRQGAGEELWQGLIQARRDGLTRDIGVSNYNEEQIEELISATGVVPVVNQIEWSPFGYSEDMLDFCHEHKIIIQAYSPLTHAQRLDDDVLHNIAKRHNRTSAQVMIRWNLQLGTVPIIKANSPIHQEENLDVFDFELSRDEMEALNLLNEEYSSLGSLAYV